MPGDKALLFRSLEFLIGFAVRLSPVRQNPRSFSHNSPRFSGPPPRERPDVGAAISAPFKAKPLCGSYPMLFHSSGSVLTITSAPEFPHDEDILVVGGLVRVLRPGSIQGVVLTQHIRRRKGGKVLRLRLEVALRAVRTDGEISTLSPPTAETNSFMHRRSGNSDFSSSGCSAACLLQAGKAMTPQHTPAGRPVFFNTFHAPNITLANASLCI